MSQTVAYIQHNLRTEYDVKIVEHAEKPDTPTRLSLMVYGAHNGLAIFTLERRQHWQITEVKTNDYLNVEWPTQTYPALDVGALDLVVSILESIPKTERVA